MAKAKKKTILIIDHDQRLAKIYGARFEEVGWRTVVTRKVAEARKRLARVVPDAVLIDPWVEEGMTLVAELRADARIAQVPIVALTDHSAREEIRQARAAGLQTYMLKSHIAPGEVVAKVKQLIDMKTQKGFTMVELLVVIAVVALVAVFAAVAVNAARAKQRDATRLSNVRQVQSALEDYFNENNRYPAGELLPLGDVGASACLGASGFAASCSTSSSIFLRAVPGTYENGLDGIVTCGEPARRAFCYSSRQEGESYVLYFELENAFGPVGLQEGVNCATPEGMEAGLCGE